MKAILGLVILWSFQTAHAKELTFKFDIYSSGPMIYACNAGIKHEARQCRQVCHLAGKPAIPEFLCQAGDHDCVCTGTNGGAYLMDFMRYRFRKWNGGSWSASSAHAAAQASNTNVYSEVALQTNMANPFAVKLDQVNFNLGSEQYGAKFFVDICFRGSQIDYYSPEALADVATSNLAAAAVTVSDVSSLSAGHPVGPGGVPGTFRDYLKLSGLRSRARVICDVQAHGRFKYAHNGSGQYNGQYDTLDNEVVLRPRSNRMGNGRFNFFRESNWVKPTASTQVLLNTWINRNNSAHPRFCIVRYEFEETTCAERKWQRHDARVCLQTKIEEATTEE